MPPRCKKPFRYVEDMPVSAMKRAVTTSPLSRGDAFTQSYIFQLMFKPPKETPPSVLFVLSVPELVEEILSWCDFPTLMAVSRVNQHFRELAMVAVRIRLRDHVDPFIPRLDFWPFMDMLNATGGAIVGSIPRLLMAENAVFNALPLSEGGARFNPPHNMNLVVRHGMLDLARDWLTQHGGYSVWEKVKLHDAFREVALEIYRGTRPANGTTKRARITITHSRDGVVQVALAIPITCQANFFTSTRLYSPYPHLITDRDTLRTDKNSLKYVRLPRNAHEIHESNVYWPKACGPYCPGMVRKTVGDKGIASFVWNPRYEVPKSRYDDTDYLLAESVLVWQFSRSCANVKCPNYGSSQLNHMF